MPPVWIPFDGWSPDGGYFGEGWSSALNLYHADQSYRPWHAFDRVGSGVADGPPTGRHVHLWAASIGTANYQPDAPTLFAGTPTNLYTVNVGTGAFTSVKRAAAYAANPAGWRFVSIGNDIWATNWVDVPQRRTNNTGNFADGVVSTFVPQPRYLAAIREHMVGYNLSNAARFQDEVVWSDADDGTNFDPPTTTSTSIAGSKRLVSIPGQGTGLVGGQYGLAFKRKGIYYLEYAGPPAIFRPDILTDQVGTSFGSSIISTEAGVFFLGNKNTFYKIAGLSAPTPISPPGIQWYVGSANYTLQGITPSAAWVEDVQVVGFQIPFRPIIGWALGSTAAGGGNTVALLYNYALDTWSEGYVTISGWNTFAFIERPYAATQDETLCSLVYDGASSKIATHGGAAASAFGPSLQLRFRPANFEAAGKQKQSIVNWVLPVFSKTTLSGTALTPSVTVESMLDPFNNVYGTPEVRTSADRDTISGAYPFQIAGRLFRITITCTFAEEFANFEGVWVNQELLT